MNDMNTDIRLIRAGDTSKPDPFTICLIANPALEAPNLGGRFKTDPIMARKSDFDVCVDFAVACLYGDLPSQGERLLDPPDIRAAVRVVSVFVSGLPPTDKNSLVGEDSLTKQIIARRTAFRPFLARLQLDADIGFAVTASTSHNHATAWDSTDDDARNGVPFTLDGTTLHHRHFSLIPGTVALHVTDRDLTPLHEFQHAVGSYSNGQIADLYHKAGIAVNKKQGRPIPASFTVYRGTNCASDLTRDGIGYPSSWNSYHCELNFPSAPAVMDNYFDVKEPVTSLMCENDKVTRDFLRDRIRAKMRR